MKSGQHCTESLGTQHLTSGLDLGGRRVMMVTEKACGKCDALQGKRKQPTPFLVREGRDASKLVGHYPLGLLEEGGTCWFLAAGIA